MSIIIRIIITVVLSISILACPIQQSQGDEKMVKALRNRIDGLYTAYKERNYEKFLSYKEIDTEEMAIGERVAILKQALPILIRYKIKEFLIAGDKAKIVMTETSIIDGKEDTFDSFDYWEFKNGDWQLVDFGRDRIFPSPYPGDVSPPVKKYRIGKSNELEIFN